MNERIRAYRDTLLLTLIALPLGLAIGAMDALFGRVLLSVTAFRTEHVFYLLPFLHRLVLPEGGRHQRQGHDPAL